MEYLFVENKERGLGCFPSPPPVDFLIISGATQRGRVAAAWGMQGVENASILMRTCYLMDSSFHKNIFAFLFIWQKQEEGESYCTN